MSEKSIKAFNQGYNLAKLDPLKAKELVGSINSNSPEIMQYFKAGARECEIEKSKNFMTERNFKGKDRDLNKGFGYSD